MSIPRGRRRRRFVTGLSILLLIAGAAAVIPGSPVHLAEWWNPSGSYEGRSAREWARDTRDPDPAVRAAAAAALGRIGAAANDRAPRVLELLASDPDPRVRAAAADALRRLPFDRAAGVPVLAAALSDDDPLVRLNATVALTHLRGEARPAVPALLAAVADEDNDTNLDTFTVTVRQSAVVALGHAAAGTAAAVAPLAALLAEPADGRTRAATLRALVPAGRHAAAVAPLVRRFLTDPNELVRESAAEALAAMGEPAAGPVVRREFDNLSLPESERKRLWDIEHRGNLLNATAFAAFAAALAKPDEARLSAALAPGFTASEPSRTRRVERTAGCAVARLDADGPSKPLSREEFLRKLFGWRQAFGGAVPTVKLVQATLRPKDAAKPADSWEGDAILRLHGATPKGEPVEVVIDLGFVVVEPTDRNLSGDGWLTAVAVNRVYTGTAPRPLFEESAAARGFDVAGLHDNWTTGELLPQSGGVFVADFNRDGYLDVLITDANKTALYAGGTNGRFRDVTAAVELPAGRMLGACAWVDIDGDGWEDLVIGGTAYRNAGGTRFESRGRLPVPADCTGLVVADYDRDGRLDLYAARAGEPGNLSWLEGRSNDARGNRLLRNLGDWKFQDVTKKAGVRGGYRSSFTAAWLDADGDGWPDLVVPNEFGDAQLLVNNRDGTFRPKSLADRPADFGTMGLAVGDLDNDGRIDIYCANMYSKAGTRVIGNLKADAYPPPVMERLRRLVAGSQLHLNRGGLTFEQVGAAKRLAAVGWAYGPALADLDSDGFLDVFATAGYISRDRRKPDG